MCRGEKSSKYLNSFVVTLIPHIYCYTLLVWNGQRLLKKMPGKYDKVFDTCEHFWVDLKQKILFSPLATRGRTNFFSKNWNFVTKKIVHAQFCKKITSMMSFLPFLDKKALKITFSDFGHQRTHQSFFSKLEFCREKNCVCSIL